MKKIRRFILRNWFWIALGCVLQRKAIEMAYLERGYKAVGGEWLVLPIVVMLAVLSRNIFWNIVEVMQMEDGDVARVRRNSKRLQR